MWVQCSWLVTYRDDVSSRRQSPIPVPTIPNNQQTATSFMHQTTLTTAPRLPAFSHLQFLTFRNDHLACKIAQIYDHTKINFVCFIVDLCCSEHRRRLPNGNGGDCPRRKTPHMVPPCEELDSATIFTLFRCELRVIIYRCHWCHDLQSVVNKPTVPSWENQQKLQSPELRFLTQICIKSFVDWGFAPDPTGWA